MKRWGVFNALKNLQYISIKMHVIGPSSSLRISISSLLLFNSIEKTLSPSLAYYSWRNFQIFTYFRLELNLTIYLTLPYSPAFSLVSSSLCFLHIFNTLLSVWFQIHWVPLLPFFSLSHTLKEIKRFYLQNLSKQMSPELQKGKKRKYSKFCFCCRCDCFNLQYVFISIKVQRFQKHISFSWIESSVIFKTSRRFWHF